jgi:hypothetical protein
MGLDHVAQLPDCLRPGQDHLGTVTDPLFKDEVLAFLEGCRHE